MFGLLHALFGLTMRGAYKIQNDIEDTKAREIGKSNGDLTYYSKSGRRLVSNNRLVFRDYITDCDGNMHDVIRDFKTGEIYKDYTQEKIEKQKEYYKSKGYTVYSCTYEVKKEFQRKYPELYYEVRNIWKDIETGEFYTSVLINGVHFYASVENGKIVRIADHRILENKIGNLPIETAIEIFNKRQEQAFLTGEIERTNGEVVKKGDILWYNILFPYPDGYEGEVFEVDDNLKITDEFKRRTK